MDINFLSQKVGKEDIIAHISEKGSLIGVSLDDIGFHEGYRYQSEKESVPRYGARWADMICFMALYHEISHAVEMFSIDPERLLRPFFGMGVMTQVEVAGLMYDQPITTQATERECLVNAIQSKLMAYLFGFDESIMLEVIIKESADSLYLMGDHLNIAVPESLKGYQERQDYRKEWIRAKVREYHEVLCINDILEALKKVSSFRK